MCSNYEAAREEVRWRRRFGMLPPGDPVPPEQWPGYMAPFIRRADTVEHQREAVTGLFGLVPHWAKDLKIARQTYNARSETAHEKPSFRDSWRRGRRCIIPAESFYEPSWESGKAERWRIRGADGEPLGIAGLWSWWLGPDGAGVLSMTMLTVNANGHDLMRRFHRPEDEKRMVVILDPVDYDRWLDAPLERMPEFMQRYPAEQLEAEPAPLPPRKRT